MVEKRMHTLLHSKYIRLIVYTIATKLSFKSNICIDKFEGLSLLNLKWPPCNHDRSGNDRHVDNNNSDFITQIRYKQGCTNMFIDTNYPHLLL